MCIRDRLCGTDRTRFQGLCGVGDISYVSSYGQHLGEEPELVPSGTIFFSGCNLHCIYCQNWDISWRGDNGFAVDGKKLAEIMEELSETCRNINLVGGDPIPHIAVILDALAQTNINKPVIWNSNMYLSEEGRSLLRGIVDLFLTDFKYGNDGCAEKLSGVKNYFSIASESHLWAKNEADIIIRHLVLPGHIECCTKPVLDWIYDNMGSSVRVNLMDQYSPNPQVRQGHGDLSQPLSSDEFEAAVRYAHEIGLENLVGIDDTL